MFHEVHYSTTATNVLSVPIKNTKMAAIQTCEVETKITEFSVEYGIKTDSLKDISQW